MIHYHYGAVYNVETMTYDPLNTIAENAYGAPMTPYYQPYGNGKALLRRTGTQLSAMFIGEVTGTAAEYVALHNLHKLDESAPITTGAIKGALKDYIVRPFQEPIEWALNYTQNIEGKENFAKRMALAPEKRAEAIASTGYRYAVSGLAGWGTAYGTNYYAAKAMGLPFDNKTLMKVMGLDAGIHLGAVAVMSAPFMANTTQKMKDALNGVFKSFGYDDNKANDMATYGITVALPNYATFAVDGALLYKINKNAMLKAAEKGLTHV